MRSYSAFALWFDAPVRSCLVFALWPDELARSYSAFALWFDAPVRSCLAFALWPDELARSYLAVASAPDRPVKSDSAFASGPDALAAQRYFLPSRQLCATATCCWVLVPASNRTAKSFSVLVLGSASCALNRKRRCWHLHQF